MKSPVQVLIFAVAMSGQLVSTSTLQAQELTTTYHYGSDYLSLHEAEEALWNASWFGSSYYYFDRWDPPLRVYHLPATQDYTFDAPTVYWGAAAPCNDGPIVDAFGNDWCTQAPNYSWCCASIEHLRESINAAYLATYGCTYTLSPNISLSFNGIVGTFGAKLPEEIITLAKNESAQVTATIGPGPSPACDKTEYPIVSAKTRGVCPGGYEIFQGGVCDNRNAAIITVTGAAIAENTNQCKVGNPCHPATGDKSLTESDYVSGTLSLERHYHSRQNYPDWAAMGKGWSHMYSSRGMLEGGKIKIVDGGGNVEIFSCVDSPTCTNYVSESESGILLKVLSNNWYVQLKTGEVRRYDSSRRLISITNPAGAYREITITYNANNTIDAVIDQKGRSLQFNYNAQGLVGSVTLPDGSAIQYEYATPPQDYTTNARWNLIRVTYPSLPNETMVRHYHYDDPNFGNLLTGITDENGDEFASYAYDTHGRVVSSQHAGGAGLVTLDYLPGNGSWLTTNVTTPAGTTLTYEMESGPFRKPKSIKDADPMSPRGDIIMEYDPATGWISSRTDRKGNQTAYFYLDGLHERVRVEAAGTTEQRYIVTNWDSVINRIIYIGEPGQTSAYEHNARGQITRKTIYGGTRSRVTDYTYFEPPAIVELIGKIQSIDGPRTDLPDITTYEYYTSDDPSGFFLKGDLQAVVNALGHRTDYLKYDGNGRPLEIRDANNIVTTIEYHPRGWISSRTTDGKTTSFSYDLVGNLTRVTQADGSFTEYFYDAAHRLYAIEDNFGNRIEYTLDAAGNREAEDTYNDLGALRRHLERVYNELNQLDFLTDGNGDITDYGYDFNGNRESTLDANINNTSFEYDALDRLKTTIDALLGETELGYDGRDNLTSVTDPLGNVTQYIYDGLDNQTQLDSPDTGITDYEYDDAGNRTAATDSRGIRVEYDYDELNRLIDITYPDSTLDVTFTYDVGTNGIGRLTGMTDAAGTVTYTYDARGNLIQEDRTIGGLLYVTHYDYNDADRLRQITYPSGMVVDYTLDAAGRVVAVDRTDGAGTDNLVSSVTYEPFGPVSDFTYGNGLAMSAGYDLDYELEQLSSGPDLDWTYGHDPVGNILTIEDSMGGAMGAGPQGPQPPGGSLDFIYDEVNRLVSGPEGLYEYDANGNRTQHTVTFSAIYDYEPQSNRLIGAYGYTYSRDAAGNRISKLAGSFGYLYTYGDHNRLIDVTSRVWGVDTLVGTYAYDGRGQRIIKDANGVVTHFVYGLNGELLGEYSTDGNLAKEYIYFNGQPVAVQESELELIVPPSEIVEMDNGDPGTSSTGSWSSHSDPEQYGSDYLDANAGNRGWATYRWTPTLGASEHEVYAWWVAKPTHSSSVAYTIVHGGGTDVVVKSHQVDGGQWNLLGTYTGVEYVEVSAASGKLVADAVRFEEPEGPPVPTWTYETYYVHSDHLGTPRRLSDESGTTVWLWEVHPAGFGNGLVDEDPDGDGTDVTLNLRFPGQYYDAESGLNYNYFRTYDPEIGRYVESDPGGLRGGPNPFQYSFSSPQRFVDPFGLDVIVLPGDEVLPSNPARPSPRPIPGIGSILGRCAGFGLGLLFYSSNLGIDCSESPDPIECTDENDESEPDCNEHFTRCLSSALQDFPGSDPGSSRCGVCRDQCIWEGNWPDIAITGSGAVRCDYWNF